MIRQWQLFSLPLRKMAILPRPSEFRFYSSTKLNLRRPKKNELDQAYEDESFFSKDMPPLMDFLRDIHKNKAPANWFKKRLKQEFRDLEPDPAPPPEIESEYDYHDSTLSDDLRNQSRGLDSIEKEDIDVKRLRESEYDTYQMMSQNDQRRLNRLSTTTNSSSAVRGNNSVSYTRTTTSSSNGSYTSSTTTIISSSGDYHSEVAEESDDDGFGENIWDDSDDDCDDEVAPAEIIASKSIPAIESTIRSPSSENREMSSSSWSVSLNDEQDDINTEDYIKTSSSETVKLEKPIHNNIYFDWDSENRVMKPLLLIPSPRLTTADVENANPQEDLDDILDTARDKEFGTRPEDLEDDEKELLEMLREDMDAVESDDDDGDMMNINRYSQPWNEEQVPKKLENWWDRDVDLVNKAKRKVKLQTLRKAQENPLHKKCKTCPICKRECKGHKAMLAHVLNKGFCSKKLDETLKEQLTVQSIDLKKKKKKLKRDNYPF